MSDSENAQLRRVLGALLDASCEATDEWDGMDRAQSPELLAARWAADEVLGHNHEGVPPPDGAREILLGSGSPV